MKHLAKFMTGALALGLWACSSQEPVPGGGANSSEGDVFTNLTLALPTSTRSETVDPGENPGENPAESNDGFEPGKDYENNVNQIYVILAEKTESGEYLYVSKSLSNSILSQSSSKPTYTVQFNSEELSKYVDKNSDVAGIENYEGKSAYVFAYCNPTPALIASLNELGAESNSDRSFTDKIGEITDGDNIDIATEKIFLMSNALPTEVKLPTLETLVRNHSTTATAFNLGTVSVERVACRFDFQSKYDGEEIDNNYTIKDSESGLEAAVIEIQALSLFNEAKEYYFLPRVSADGTETKAEICGRELTTNWVVSPNADKKTAFANGGAYSDIANNYFFNLNTLPENYNFTEISSLNVDDNEEWKNGRGTLYKVWRYATENTMPGAAAQKYGITTGIVFRGEIKPASDQTGSGTDYHPAKIIADAMAAGEPLYSYSEAELGTVNQTAIMLGSAYDVWKYAKTHNTSVIRSQFVDAVLAGYFSIFDGNGTEIKVDESVENYIDVIFGSNVANAKGMIANNMSEYVDDNNFNFTVYNPTKDKTGKLHYYIYYYYYNRHNDNDDPAIMGTMEFATVRNNIYKIKVDNVLQFGLPGDVPPPPPTDDETPEIYFKVSVQVLDWVVRVNNIIL